MSNAAVDQWERPSHVSDVVKVIVDRESVAMGDDVDSHMEFWMFPASATVDDLMVEISKYYLPGVNGPAGWCIYLDRDGRSSRRALGLIYKRDDLRQEDYICRLVPGRRTLSELARFSEMDVYASYLTSDEARPVWLTEVTSSGSFTGCRPTKLESEAEAQAKHAWWLVKQLDREASITAAARHEWIRDNVISAGTWPSGAEAFIARNFHFLPDLLCPVSMDIAGNLLGVGETLRDGLPENFESPTMATLAMMLAGFEWGLRKQSWRFGERKHCKVYLEFLAACGYSLSPIEHVMAGHIAVDDLLDSDSQLGERVARIGRLRNAQNEIRMNHYRGNTSHQEYEALIQPINAELTALGEHPGPPLGCCR